MAGTEYKLPEPQPNWALFLDVDGTLIDLAPTPSQVIIPPELRGILQGLVRVFGGAVALVSGRTIADVDRLFAPLSLGTAGQHGAEIRTPDGTTEILGGAVPGLGQIVSPVMAFAASRPGIIVENKGMTLAVHYRLAPQYQAELGRFLGVVVADCGPHLETIQGHSVFEIKSRSLSKRTAIDRFMHTAPFTGRLPVFIGDDRTDEDGFSAVHSHGGHAIRVGLHGASIAALRIADPWRVRAFLSHIVEVLSADGR